MRHLFLLMMMVVACSQAFASAASEKPSLSNESAAISNSAGDIKGWGPIRWGMGLNEIRKEFGKRVVKADPDSVFSPPIYEYVIKDVSIGPLNVNLHIGDIGDGVRQLITEDESIMSAQQAEKLYQNLEKDFSNRYGKAEILMNAISKDQSYYIRRLRWKFPTTTVTLKFEYQYNQGKYITVIDFSKTTSEKDSFVFTRSQLAEFQRDHSLVVVTWNLKPIIIFNRNEEDIAHIRSVRADDLSDPTSTGALSLVQSWAQEKYPVEEPRNLEFPQLRSRTEKFGVYSATSPISGCILLYFAAESSGGERFEKVKAHAVEQWGDDWRGFYDPCANEYFDMAGRAYKYDDFSSNLSIPKHRYDDEGNLIIGY